MGRARAVVLSLALFCCLAQASQRESWRCALDLVDYYDAKTPSVIVTASDVYQMERHALSAEYQFSLWFQLRTRLHCTQTRRLDRFLAQVMPAVRTHTPEGRERLEMKYRWGPRSRAIEMALPDRYQHTLVYYALLAYPLERYLLLADPSMFVRGDYNEEKVYALADFVDLMRWEYVIDKKAIRNAHSFLKHLPGRHRTAWADKLLQDPLLDLRQREIAAFQLENADLPWEEYWAAGNAVGYGGLQALLARDRNLELVRSGGRDRWPVSENEKGEILRGIETDEVFNEGERNLLIQAVYELSRPVTPEQ